MVSDTWEKVPRCDATLVCTKQVLGRSSSRPTKSLLHRPASLLLSTALYPSIARSRIENARRLRGPPIESTQRDPEGGRQRSRPRHDPLPRGHRRVPAYKSKSHVTSTRHWLISTQANTATTFWSTSVATSRTTWSTPTRPATSRWPI